MMHSIERGVVAMQEEIITYLKEQVAGDDKELLDSLYAEYCLTAKEYVASLKTALPAGDFSELKKLAHTLKGNSAMVGDKAMNAHALAFENGAKAEALATCQAEILELENLLKELD